jgi:hypothetical protein
MGSSHSKKASWWTNWWRRVDDFAKGEFVFNGLPCHLKGLVHAYMDYPLRVLLIPMELGTTQEGNVLSVDLTGAFVMGPVFWRAPGNSIVADANGWLYSIGHKYCARLRTATLACELLPPSPAPTHAPALFVFDDQVWCLSFEWGLVGIWELVLDRLDLHKLTWSPSQTFVVRSGQLLPWGYWVAENGPCFVACDAKRQVVFKFVYDTGSRAVSAVEVMDSSDLADDDEVKSLTHLSLPTDNDCLWELAKTARTGKSFGNLGPLVRLFENAASANNKLYVLAAT